MTTDSSADRGDCVGDADLFFESDTVDDDNQWFKGIYCLSMSTIRTNASNAALIDVTNKLGTIMLQTLAEDEKVAFRDLVVGVQALILAEASTKATGEAESEIDPRDLEIINYEYTRLLPKANNLSLVEAEVDSHIENEQNQTMEALAKEDEEEVSQTEHSEQQVEDGSELDSHDTVKSASLEVNGESENVDLGSLVEQLRWQDLALTATLAKAHGQQQLCSKLMIQLSARASEAQTNHVRLEVEEHAVAQAQKIEDLEQQLNTANTKLAQQDKKLERLESLQDFKEQLRFRCFHTYRKNVLGQALSDKEQDKIRQANDMVHGGDCLFDMKWLIRNPESPHCEEYRRIDGVHPAAIFESRSNEKLLQAANMFGNISMNDNLLETEIEEFKDYSLQVLNLLCVTCASADELEHQSLSFSQFKSRHEEFDSTARSRRTTRGRWKFEKSLRSR